MKEDILLYENFFYGMIDGLIIESGALDGILFSTTYMFEHLFNWTSIHIEGNSHHYNALQINRPHSININAALCNESRTLHYLFRIGGSPVDGILEFMEPEFIRRFHKMYHLTRSSDRVREVQCIPFKDIMRKLEIRHIDIWVLDVEGGELQVLQGTDFQEVEIDVILVETTRRDFEGAESSAVLTFLQEKSYSCTPLANNHVCLRDGFVPSTMPGATLGKHKSKLGKKRTDSLRGGLKGMDVRS